MPISFDTTTGRLHNNVGVTASALTASTVYVATLTNGDGRTQRTEFTTDGTGAATFTVVPNVRGALTLTATPKVTAAAVTSTNTYMGV